MKALIKLILAVSFFISANAFADKDYCHDAAINSEWERMIKKYPDDDMVLHLAGLREGLCNMVDRGEISRDKAIDIFESAKGGAVSQRFTEDILNKKNDISI